MPFDGQNIVIRERLEILRKLAATPGGNQLSYNKCLWSQARHDQRLQRLGIIKDGDGTRQSPSKKSVEFFGLTTSQGRCSSGQRRSQRSLPPSIPCSASPSRQQPMTTSRRQTETTCGGFYASLPPDRSPPQRAA